MAAVVGTTIAAIEIAANSIRCEKCIGAPPLGGRGTMSKSLGWGNKTNLKLD
jgi:hypothetical protein